MMLDQITPLILTYNEAPNIARTLANLIWARDIVVVDSFSLIQERLDIAPILSTASTEKSCTVESIHP